MPNRFLIIGAILIALSIVMGAFAAHGLQSILDPNQIDSFETGARYNMYGGLSLIVLQLLEDGRKISLLWPKRMMLLGTVFFSFSIYLLNLSGPLGLESLKPVLGPITPIGGVLLIAAWMVVVMVFSRRRK